MRRAVLGALLALIACTDPPPPTPQARYVVGEPYQLGGLWFYPREDLSLTETGLASVAADTRPGRRTANGDIHDPGALVAAHRTLQLPAVLRVTNLENGREVLVRVNDRGPGNPGRVVELSRRAAVLLGVSPDRPAQVRVAVDGNLSGAATAGLPSSDARGPRVEAIATAPVERESLEPPPGARAAGSRPAGTASAAVADPVAPATPVELPDRAVQGTPSPGRLFVAGSTFAGRDAASRQAVRIGARARAEPVGSGRRAEWRVRAGPFDTVSEADRTLEQALRAGVSEARILVE
ncbi:RlpA-like double-psi beta-barrel domain-containing protein [Roseomonas sp. CCTCC AB2023176]|uniref:RlpA-like double-psi beta-barrel domain-containing protein n=1 Tax=Roseomonas sp. CCTCC AB2023176 TaxID=3342640 RepID=UPI0035E005B9